MSMPNDLEDECIDCGAEPGQDCYGHCPNTICNAFGLPDDLADGIGNLL